MLDVGLEKKIVTKSGSYFSFGDERLRPGTPELECVPQGASGCRPGHPATDSGRRRAGAGRSPARLLPQVGDDLSGLEASPAVDEVEVEVEVEVEA